MMRGSRQYSARVDQALALAADAFRDRTRRGTRVPYLSHLLQVMVTVMEFGGDEDQIIAAVLHDYLEDIEGSSFDELSAGFGERVASMVEALSDSTEQAKPPWKERKSSYLAHLRTQSRDVKLVSAADKLHNARCIHRDYLAVGEAVWARFHADREQTLWYYREVVAALAEDWQHPLLDELGAAVQRLCEATSKNEPLE